ncbi:hypothetical protein V8C26DRAFT_214055 [Trichoderma gracile]
MKAGYRPSRGSAAQGSLGPARWKLAGHFTRCLQVSCSRADTEIASDRGRGRCRKQKGQADQMMEFWRIVVVVSVSPAQECRQRGGHELGRWEFWQRKSSTRAKRGPRQNGTAEEESARRGRECERTSRRCTGKGSKKTK